MRQAKVVWYLIAAVLGLVMIQKVFVFYTDYLWYDALGQAAVFSTILTSRIVLFLLFSIPFFIWLFVNARHARKPLPNDITLIGKRLLPEEEREQIEEYADKAILIFCIIGAVMVGLVGAGHWREWLQFTHAVPFAADGSSQNDPIFGIDAGFYVFKLAFLQYMWRSIFYTLVITLVVSTLLHFYQEAIRVVGNIVQAIDRARAHVLSLLALTLFAKIYLYRLMQFGLLHSTHGKDFFGASYADVHARLPLLWIMMGLCAIAGIICLVSIKGRSLKVPGGAVAAVILVSILGGWLYPQAIQTLVVQPNELELERPYIEHNIRGTNLAYGTDKIVDKVHPVSEKLTWADVNDNMATINNIRLWDHRPLETCYQQVQALRKYYQFADVDVDRYVIDGEERQVMLSARQLAYDRIADSWVNRHLLYTHGYGVAMSPVAEITNGGQPEYWIKDLPPSSSVGLNVSQPAIYYGASWHPRLIERIAPPEFPRDEEGGASNRPAPASPMEDPTGSAGPQGPVAGPQGPVAGPQPNAVSAGAPQVSSHNLPLFTLVNTTAAELDYPRVSPDNGVDGGNVTTHYSGTGGVLLNSAWRRFAFAVRFGLSRNYQLLFTESITPQTRLQMHRELPERLQEIAPFLGYDPDPYIVVAKDGHLKWLCDAYTVSNMYPYSVRTTWFGNYLRNSVKVVVDAYEGRPEFYVVQPDDPVVQCYQSIFPTLFKPFEQMDKSLQKHVRYPQLIFRIQAGIYAKYHMKDPQTFYQAEDEWAIPPEVYSDGYREVESYYQFMKMPGQEKEEFLLMLPYVLAKFERKNMVAWMAARCDVDDYGELVAFRFPKDKSVSGPMQFEARVDQDAGLSELMTLWSQAGSRVIRGNTLAIPVAASLLYVEPIYLESSDSPIPELKLVVLMFGNKLAFAPTLDGALDKLLGAGGQVAHRSDASAKPRGEAATIAGVSTSVDVAAVRALLERAISLDLEAEKYLSQGDLGKYRETQQAQQRVIQEARDSLK